MLGQADVDALIAARHADPFAVLGLHSDSDGAMWVRALLPGADDVQVLDARTRRSLATLSLRHPDGLFEGKIPLCKTGLDYR
ncbi:MAG: 1,4-alpha-glucan branching enzyme, partial [Burkholderiales bacterium]